MSTNKHPTPVQEACDAILKQPCMYTIPPLMFLNGHQFCPCICKAIRTAYIGGYRAGKLGETPEVGVDPVKQEEMENEGC